MKVYAKTRKTHYWNEDRFIIGKDYFMVIDGATPLIKVNNFNEACWMVNYIKKNINKLKGNIKERLLVLSKDGFNKLPVKMKDEEYLPSAGMAWVEYDEKYFYANVLGDCEVTFITKDGQIVRCHTTRLNELDGISISELVKNAKERNIHVSEARPYICDTLLKHRKMINKENGYNAFALSDSPVINEVTLKIEKENVKQIYLYTDGFAQSYDHIFVYKNHEEMFKNDLDLEEEIKKIVIKSFSDPYCDKYPRLKKIDDITAIKIEM